MPLKEYQKKRKFNKTPEPGPLLKLQPRKAKGALRFVVQKHDATALHYDFRLEMDGALKSWAVPKGPSMNPADKRLAMMVEDHPLSYADFEGVIPKGNYGAGEVIVWDRGNYSSLQTVKASENEQKLKSGLRRGELKFNLSGKKLKGGFVLVKIDSPRYPKKNAWLLIKERDRYAKTSDITKNRRSVMSGAILSRDAKKSRKTKKK